MSVPGKSPRRLLGSALKYGILTLGAAFMIVPFADMFIGALRVPTELMSRPPQFWPREPQWGA